MHGEITAREGFRNEKYSRAAQSEDEVKRLLQGKDLEIELATGFPKCAASPGFIDFSAHSRTRSNTQACLITLIKRKSHARTAARTDCHGHGMSEGCIKSCRVSRIFSRFATSFRKFYLQRIHVSTFKRLYVRSFGIGK